MRLEELADRVEAASGPDRELDALIAKAFDLPNGRDSGFCNDENGDYWVVEECAAKFTASLDAAMSLVPEGWGRMVSDHALGGAIAELRPGGYHPGGEDTFDVHGRAATWPLALTAASLRSRDTGGDDA